MLSKHDTPSGFLGSSGERRARELAEAGKYEFDGRVYFIERRHIGKYAEYRVASVAAKPRQVVEQLPNGNVRVSYV